MPGQEDTLQSRKTLVQELWPPGLAVSHTILGMGSRLEQLETSLADTQRSLKRLFEGSSTVSSSSGHPPSPAVPTPQLTDQRCPDSLKLPVFTRPLGRFVVDQNSDERCFGPTSLESLMLNIKDELLQSPDLERHTVKECVMQAQRKIDLLVGQGQETPIIGEKSPPAMPPFAILDAMIEPYFTTTNDHFPIWTKKRFTQMATTLRQASPSERDLASIVCCNNLIIMAMSADSLGSHQWESMISKQSHKTSSIDFDLIAGFLTNAKRAVSNIDQLVSPHLINVQALLSLHIVAQVYLSISISETLLALATRCAKSIGIHQWHSFQSQLSDDDVKEKQNLSYCLYVLDKAVCWTAGSSPSIPVSEVHFDPRLAPSENGIPSCLVAKAEMARIEETVYLEIYAVHVQARDEDQVRGFAASVLSRLQVCLTESGVDLDKIQKSLEGSASNLQLAIRYLSVQLLLIWPHKHHPDPMFQRAPEVARMCLKLLLRLWHSPPDQGSQAVFSFFLASLPPLYLYEVLSSILGGQGSNWDIDMLQEFVEMLQTITDCRAEASYNRRLYQLSLIVTDVIKARKTQHKRQKPTSEGPTNPYLMPELLSPPTSGYGCMTSDVQETYDSRFDSAVFQDPDGSFASMDPIPSASGELARGSDSFLPQLRSYAKTAPGNENFNSLAMEALGESVLFWKGVNQGARVESPSVSKGGPPPENAASLPFVAELALEDQTAIMGSIKDYFGVLCLGAAAGIYFKPEYAIYDSRIAAIAVLITGITISKLLYQLFIYPQFFTPLKHFPAPPNRHWLTGNTGSLLVDTPHALMKEWAKTIPNDGILRYYIVGNMERLTITSPAVLSEILVSKAYDFAKPLVIQQTLRRVLGNGILIAEGEEHKFQRKNLKPAFAYRHIKDLYPVFWSKGTEMAKLIRKDLQSRKAPEDNTIQVRTWASRSSLDIIGLAGMGRDFDSLHDPENSLSQSYEMIFATPGLGTKILFILGMLLGNTTWLAKLPTRQNKLIDTGCRNIRDATRRMIREQKVKMEDPTAGTEVDIISVAMRSGNFDDENLVDQLMTFLGAGHETTAGALQWAVYALCKHPEVQTRLRDEVRANLPSVNAENPSPIDAATIDSLQYLNAVCNEVIRFHPSVPNTVRVALNDTTLLGKPIPKGTQVVISPELVNHMPALWGPDAEQFNPDRWMGPGRANTGGASSNYAFLSFLHGPRSCIGQGFAKAELACLLAAVVGSFEFELKYPDAPLEVREGATIAPKDGVLAKFTPLEGW
ncbi:hypothetical protein IFM58399_03997 [Aspergillus lentulus]|uniref:uncharacterized protein n=1 Tax=Aspergillus lentulus TaxID=293939 RepID=UPI001392E687|nr:uncharacterized protein IFM58399_03997 [Aspergillus lentulus]GFF34800.1 hypothetical protein IFM58399_03997 [Aspergillus lentulus]